MRRSLSTLALVAAMATGASLSVPTQADAHHFGHRLGHGFYRGFHHSFGHGFGAHGYGYGYERPRCNCGSVRIELAQSELRGRAEVLVDGAHAGVVDDFDGVFQSLRLPTGGHEIQVAVDGYRTFHRRILVSRGRTY